ncbi:MAG: hypothetical protein LBQ24_05290 [Candidatus Peribacteria bacterium]|jgi:hypothetical protein|nr:hypothetical protein [Candidatus Peribacteria bacterium]
MNRYLEYLKQKFDFLPWVSVIFTSAGVPHPNPLPQGEGKNQNVEKHKTKRVEEILESAK